MAARDPLGRRVDGVARVAGLGVEGDAAVVSLLVTRGSMVGVSNGKIRRVPGVFEVGDTHRPLRSVGIYLPTRDKSPLLRATSPVSPAQTTPPKVNSHA